jgi:hypothetical protein
MTYLCKFDDDGKRIATVVEGVHYKTDAEKAKYIADGYIETSDEDYQYYIGNRGTGENGTGYIRGEDGKPTDAPAYVPTKDEQLAQLDEQYNADKADLLTAYQTAQLYGDTDTMDSLKADLTALDDQYDEDYEKIVGGE